MGRGCIVDDCPVCQEIIWEDEAISIYEGYLVHRRCIHEAKKMEKIAKYV